MSDQVCLPTLDPRSTRGVRSVTRFAYNRIDQEEFNPYLIFNSVSWNECATLGDFFRGDFDIEYKKEIFENMNGIRIGRRLPEARIFNYIFNIKYWERALNKANKCFGIGGPCLPCLPLAIKNIPFGCWVGTSIYDEQKTQTNNFSAGRRIRDKTTLPIIKKYEKFVLKKAKSVITQSNYTKKRIMDLYNISESKIKNIPVPIDTTEFHKNNMEPNPFEIIFIGRVNDPRKNIPYLLRTFSIVNNYLPESTLTLVGEEPNDHLCSLINQLEIEESIRCEGEVPDVVPYLNRASVLALPSKQEGLGIVGLEAQSCGTPVVATRCGGPEDYVKNNQNGFLVPQNDPHLFSDRLIKILTDEDLRMTLSENARMNVINNYSQEVIGKKIVDVVDNLPSF